MIELITEWVDGTRWQLDVDQNAAIVLKKTFLDLTDISVRKGEYSQGFSLPRSQNNDWFFGRIGDPSSVGDNWTTRFEAPAILLEDSDIVIEGSMKLESTDPRDDRYNVSISGKIATIKSILGDGQMAELNMSAWSYTPAQIFTTWSRTIFGGHLVFPIHDFGFGYGLYKKSAGSLQLQNIGSVQTPIVLDQCIPAFRLNELLRMLFNEKGITVEGSWFSESEVEEIYVQAANPLKAFASGVGLITTKLTQYLTLSASQLVIPFNAVPDSGDWNETLHEYVVPQNGTYYWDFTITPYPGVPNSVIVLYQFQVNGINVGPPTLSTWDVQTVVTNHAITVVAGDTIRLTVQVGGAFTTAGQLIPIRINTLNLSNVFLTGTATDPSVYWSSTKQIDFLRGIIQTFNLIVWIEKNNKVRIDTWDYYMANYGTKKDWSNKLDQPSIVVKPINGELRNPIFLANRQAKDILNVDYQNIAGRPYGSYREETNIPFTQSEAEPNALFAPVPLQSIISSASQADYPEVLIAKYYKDEDSIAYESPGLQLMYYNGERSVPFNIRTADSVGGATTVRGVYPYFSNFRLYLASSWQVITGTLDLNFTWWTPPSPSIVTAPTDQGLYNRYFREMLRERYDLANKILELKFDLNAFDIANFSFADTIIITVNNTPVGLKILEIKDYSPTKRKLTTVKAMITFID